MCSGLKHKQDGYFLCSKHRSGNWADSSENWWFALIHKTGQVLTWYSDGLGDTILIFWVPWRGDNFWSCSLETDLQTGIRKGSRFYKAVTIPIMLWCVFKFSCSNQLTKPPRNNNIGTQLPWLPKSALWMWISCPACLSRRISCCIILINEAEQGDGMGFFMLRCG